MNFKNPVFILWILFILFIFYGTLIPFDISFSLRGIRSSLDQADLIPFFTGSGDVPLADTVSDLPPFSTGGRDVPLMDIVSNLLLFIVYGILFHSAFIKPRTSQLWIFSICVISSFLFSTLIETYQFFSVSRISSVNDVIIDTVGGAIGCGASWIFHRFYKEKLTSWSKGILSARPLLLILLIYSLLMFLSFLFPFNISIRVSDISHSVGHINFIPFENYQSYQNYFRGVGGELALYLILGFLINLCLIRYAHVSKIVASIYTVVLAGIFSVGIEITQVFFISRVTDVTDLITAIFGAMLGVFASNLLNRKKLLISLYIAFIFYYALAPFAFSFEINRLINSVSMKSLVPFHAYWEHTTVFAFEDFVEGIALYLLLGFLILLKSRERTGFGLLYFFYGLTLGLLLECCQLFITERHFDITDVLLAGIGTSLGGWCYLKFSKYQEEERSLG